MSTTSNIEWTDVTWNPVVGCTRVSAGCDNCYAVGMTRRLERMAKAPGRKASARQRNYVGLTVLNGKGEPHFNGKVRTVEDALGDPLRWKEPRRVFVNSMSDLFHKDVPFEFIDRVFAVMALTPHHTYQILTKRPERMAEYLNESRDMLGLKTDERVNAEACHLHHLTRSDVVPELKLGHSRSPVQQWPLPNVHLGTSCEHQKAADERIPRLLRCPAAVRFLSLEPLLGPVRLPDHMKGSTTLHMCLDIKGAIRNRSFAGFTDSETGRELSRREAEDELLKILSTGKNLMPMGECDNFDPIKDGCRGHRNAGIDWVIVGGESGPGARPCNVAWIRDIVQQCKAAGVPCFVKQLGARPVCGCRGTDDLDHARIARLLGASATKCLRCEFVMPRDKKCGDPSEWPEDLRVREFPVVGGAK